MKNRYALLLIFVLTYAGMLFICTPDFAPSAITKNFIQAIAAAALWAWWMRRLCWRKELTR